jgi:hypothetical protein
MTSSKTGCAKAFAAWHNHGVTKKHPKQRKHRRVTSSEPRLPPKMSGDRISTGCNASRAARPAFLLTIAPKKEQTPS